MKSNCRPRNTEKLVDGEAELLSVIILQLNFPNLQNLFTCQCLGMNAMHPVRLVTLKTTYQTKNFV